MGSTALTWTDCEAIITAEVKRAGYLRGYDRQDLRQEAAIAASRALGRVDTTRQGTGAAFVRTSVRNALRRLRRASMAANRCPQTKTGRPLPWADVTAYDTDDLPTTLDPEQVAGARQLVRKLRSELPGDDFDRLAAVFIEGAKIAHGRGGKQRDRAENIELNLIRAHASQILDRMVSGKEGTRGDHMENIRGYRPPKTLPDCHADGENPQGYDTKEPECVGCPDKVVCLPRTITAGLAPAHLGRHLTIVDDREVQAVLGGALDYAAMYGRLRERSALVVKGEAVPPELAANYEGLVKGLDADAPDPLDGFRDPPPPKEPDPDPPAPKPTPKAEKPKPATKRKTTKRKTPAKKRGAKADAKPKPSGKACSSGKDWPMKTPIPSRTNDAGWPLMISGKAYPRTAKLSEEEMLGRLAKLKLGQPEDFAFEYGMKLVRKRRDGDDIVITLRPNGFEYNGAFFGSHSSCLMWALGRVCSGNEHLNVAKSSAAVITDAKGKVILCKAML